MRRLPVPFVFLVLLSALFCAAAGASSHSPRLTEARAPFPDRAYVLSLPSRERLDPSTVQVLEDGTDTGSSATEAAASAAARRAHVRVFTVGLQSDQFDSVALERLAHDANGQYSLATSAKQLQEIYAALGARFAREYLISYRSDASPWH